MSLSERQKASCRRQLARYYKRRERIIRENPDANGGLELLLDAERVRTPKGEKECPQCDAYSMSYVSDTPRINGSDAKSVYECEICSLDTLNPLYESLVFIKENRKKQ